ncbi:SDR family NAD(P)-dependent oxidoreductase [Arenicella sp.]|nr:SDR family NAD(P)-dependent oxidoreductase [Arenicella sp.]
MIGSNGTIGAAIVQQLSNDYSVQTLSQTDTDYSNTSLTEHFERLSKIGRFEVIICCIGVLHDDIVSPEKNLKDIDADRLAHYFKINSILPMLCLQKFTPLLSADPYSVFACLSAMVGSTTDNQLGGWYGYRSSKAALNMLVKNTAIEVARSNRKTSIIAIHPGTTVGDLSAPFAKNIDPKKYYTPEQSATRIINVMQSVTPQQSGQFFNWNGENIPY